MTINNPLSTQFVSALLLIGAKVQTDSTSPYIYITQEVIKQYQLSPFSYHLSVEKDWSSAAFWYGYVALHGGEITLPDLFRDSLQGDKVVAKIFTHLGVHTEYTAEGITIASTGVADLQRSDLRKKSYAKIFPLAPTSTPLSRSLASDWVLSYTPQA